MLFTIKRASVVAAMAMGMAMLGAAPAHAAGAVTATPSTGLADGQTIQVSVTGFPANTDLFILQCTAAPTGAPGLTPKCNLDGAVLPKTNGAGAVTTPFKVKAGPIGTDGGVCPVANDGPCYIVASTSDPSTAVGIPIDFAPTVVVAPSANLVDGQVVSVTGTGYANNASATVLQCVDPLNVATCAADRSVTTTTSATGTVSTSFTVKLGATGTGTCDKGATCYIRVATNPADPGRAAFTLKSDTLETTTTLKYKNDKFKGAVKAAGAGIAKAKVTLKVKDGKKWKFVAKVKTAANGKFVTDKITKAGKYRAFTKKKGTEYFASESKTVVVR